MPRKLAKPLDRSLLLADPNCRFCGTPIPPRIPPPRNYREIQKHCGAPRCKLKYKNGLKRRSWESRYERAKRTGLCLHCLKFRAKPNLTRCRKCFELQRIANIKYDRAAPERRLAQAQTIELAEKRIAHKRKHIAPQTPAGPVIEA